MRTVPPGAAAKILLVKAIEETGAAEIGGERLIDAITAGGDPRRREEWLTRRAEFLLGGDLARYEPLLALGRPIRIGLSALLGASFVVGLATNLLDPRAAIHVLFNPVTLLILWNLAVYVLLVGRALVPGPARILLRLPGFREPISIGPETADGDAPPPSTGSAPLLARLFLSSVWWVRRRFALKTAAARNAGAVIWSFAPDWIECAWPRIALHAARVLSWASLGLVLGAFAGMYARGLGLEYNFVWRSTFVTDPATITLILSIVFGPPAAIAGLPPPDAGTTARLLSPEGMTAGYWLHLYGLLALGLVAVPRLLMLGWVRLRLRSASSTLRLDLDDPYFRALLEHANRYRIEKVTKEIRTIVVDEAAKLSRGLAAFVAERLYDDRIVPRLRAFREEGGKIADLKADLERACADFEPVLKDRLETAFLELEAAIAADVRRLLEIDLASPATSSDGLRESIRDAAGRSASGVGGSMGAGLTDPVALTVSSALALVAGSVSGGFGTSLGTALLVGLGASGPVGFLIGALATFVAAGGAYLAGRDKIASTVEQVRLPAAVVKTVLWESRWSSMIADGRVRCEAQVEALVSSQLAPLPDRLSNEIWTAVKPLLGDELKKGVGVKKRGTGTFS